MYIMDYVSNRQGKGRYELEKLSSLLVVVRRGGGTGGAQGARAPPFLGGEN